ncbi:MAG: helix-turn-helix domain-containing protein, partial [Patescibacteria group bacterium]
MTQNGKEKYVQIGKFIAELRERMGITQGELARALKTSQSAVARMERGGQNLSTAMLAKISGVLNREIVTLGSGAINFQIEGGRKLRGRVAVNVSKNSAVALLCASLLNKSATELKNMPRIEDVNRMIEVLQSIGVAVKWKNGNNLEIVPPKKLSLAHLDVASAAKTRSVLMLLGPLIHFLPAFTLPHPGGCKLGRRTVRPHLFALQELGVDIHTTKTAYEVSVKKLHPAEIVLYESGDTPTEHAVMAAARIPGMTVIKFASANYQVQDLCFFLQKLGVEIRGIGTTTLTIFGKPDIDTPVSYSPSEDPIEAMLFLSIAATTNSSITIERCPIDFLELELLKLKKMGFKYKILKRYKARNGMANLADIRTFPSR